MAILGFGSKLSLDAGVGTFTDFTDIKSITIPDGNTSTVDVSGLNMSNTSRLHTPGLTDEGELMFEQYYTKANHAALLAVRGRSGITTLIPPTGNPIRWQITIVDEDGAGSITSLVMVFTGILTKIEMQVEAETALVMKCAVKVSGAITTT